MGTFITRYDEHLVFVLQNAVLEPWQLVYENLRVPFQKCWCFESYDKNQSELSL